MILFLILLLQINSNNKTLNIFKDFYDTRNQIFYDYNHCDGNINAINTYLGKVNIKLITITKTEKQDWNDTKLNRLEERKQIFKNYCKWRRDLKVEIEILEIIIETMGNQNNQVLKKIIEYYYIILNYGKFIGVFQNLIFYRNFLFSNFETVCKEGENFIKDNCKTDEIYNFNVSQKRLYDNLKKEKLKDPFPIPMLTQLLYQVY